METLEKKIETSSEIIAEADKKYGKRLVMASSFGMHSAVMLHLAGKIIPAINVIFVDTEYLTDETYRFADNLKKDLGIDLKIFRPAISRQMREALHGKNLSYNSGQEQFRFDLKAEPFERALRELKARACLFGNMRHENENRKFFSVYMKKNNIWRVYPILEWSEDDILRYIEKYELPVNVNYYDICKGAEQETECGIHCFKGGEGI